MPQEIFAGVCIIQNGKILLVQEAHKEAKGLWSLPLGHVENDENSEEGARRETKEETGYNVVLNIWKELIIDGKDLRSLSRFNNTKIKLVIFEGKIQDGDLKQGDDVLDTKWFTYEEFVKLPLRGKWIKSFIPNQF